MEQALQDRAFTLREIAPVAIFDDPLPPQKWSVKLAQDITTISINGQVSGEVTWNETLRSLVWSNGFAMGPEIMVGSVTFDREFRYCHGRVTSADEITYLVESVGDGQSQASYTLDDEEAFSSLGVEKIPFNLAPPPYSSVVPSKVVRFDSKVLAQNTTISSTGPKRITSQAVFTSVAWNGEKPPTSDVAVMAYMTEKTLPDEEEWEPFAALQIGTELESVAHPMIYFGKDDISPYVRIDKEGNHFLKQRQETGDPCPWSFDITFTGNGSQRTFLGKIVSAKGREYTWRGKFDKVDKIQRLGDNVRSKGTDGLFTDTLLSGVTSMSKEEIYDEATKTRKAIDLAQREADHVFGRLVLGSVDKEVSDMLFPGVITLTADELKLQKTAPNFLERASIHSVLANIKSSKDVKDKTKDKIKQNKLDYYIPMCLASITPPEGKDDPVKLYGLSRDSDKDLLVKLQTEAQALSRACYLHGYQLAVTAIQPYLNNAGEWYDTLSRTVISEAFLLDWQLRATGGEGFAKKLWDLHAKLELLWNTALETDRFKAQLPPNVDPPEVILGILNASGMMAMLGHLEFDDTAKAHFKECFSKLDELEKEKRESILVDHHKRQAIIDDSKPQSFQAMGEYLLQTAADLQKASDQRFTFATLEKHLAVLHGREVAIAGELAPGIGLEPVVPPDRKMKWSYCRAVVMAAGIGYLMYHMSSQSQKMEIVDVLALAGEISEGMSTLRSTIAGAISSVMAKAKAKAQVSEAVRADWIKSLGSWVYRKILAPIGHACKAVGRWLMKKLPQWGTSLIKGTGQLLSKVGHLVSTVAGYAAEKLGKFTTWMKELPINNPKTFMVLGKLFSFAVSAICCWVAIRDCVNVYKSGGRPIDKVMATIGAALAGLEVLCLVVEGFALIGTSTTAAAVVSFCSGFGMFLGALGIGFAIAFIVIALVFQEDKLDSLVEKWGRKFGIVG